MPSALLGLPVSTLAEEKDESRPDHGLCPKVQARHGAGAKARLAHTGQSAEPEDARSGPNSLDFGAMSGNLYGASGKAESGIGCQEATRPG